MTQHTYSAFIVLYLFYIIVLYLFYITEILLFYNENAVEYGRQQYGGTKERCTKTAGYGVSTHHVYDKKDCTAV